MAQVNDLGSRAFLVDADWGRNRSRYTPQHPHDRVRESAGTRSNASLFLALLLVLATAPLASAGEKVLVPFPAAYAQATPSQNEPPTTNQPAAELPTQEKNESAWKPPAEAQYLSGGIDYRYPLTGDYKSYYGARIFMEMFATRHHAFGMEAGAGSLRLKPGSVPDRGAHDPALFDFGFFYRLHFTPPNVLLRPYGTVHLNFGTMLWDYKDDPVSDGESYWRDSVLLVDAYVGAGLVVNATKRFHLFGEMGYGGMAFVGATRNDFENELFDDYGYVAIKAGLGLTF